MNKAIFTVEKTNTGYSAYSVQQNGAIATVGGTLAELRINALEAANMYFEAQNKKRISADGIILQYDLQQFFEYYDVINTARLAARIGMNRALLSQYINHKKTPTPKQVNKILEGIRTLGSELLAVELV